MVRILAVISTSGFAGIYFDNRTDLPITLCPRITSLDAQPDGAWNSRAGRLHPRYASSEAVKRGCGTLGGDYSAALAAEPAGFCDWAHGAPAQSIFRLYAAPAGKRDHGRPGQASYPASAKQKTRHAIFSDHRPRKALKYPA
jgi:hypothetical protein